MAGMTAGVQQLPQLQLPQAANLFGQIGPHAADLLGQICPQAVNLLGDDPGAAANRHNHLDGQRSGGLQTPGAASQGTSGRSKGSQL